VGEGEGRGEGVVEKRRPEIEFVYHAQPGTRFAAGAFDGMIGKEVKVSSSLSSDRKGRVTSAVVEEDGSRVRFRVETDGLWAAPVAVTRVRKGRHEILLEGDVGSG
jgi:hypothetical protein